MANQEAWTEGWQQGQKATQRRRKNKGGKGGGSSSGGAGGGNPWSILSLIGKSIPSLKGGGKVKKTGLHVLHKGEVVTPAHKARSRKRTTSKRTIVKA